jgi:hypothetical protein
MYLQHAERARSDVVAIDLSLLERRWYLEALARRSAALVAPSLPEVSAFLTFARRWHDDPKSIQRDQAYRTALVAMFDGLVIKLVDLQLQSADVFVTHEVATGVGGKGQTLAAALRSRTHQVAHHISRRRLVDYRQPGSQMSSLQRAGVDEATCRG